MRAIEWKPAVSIKVYLFLLNSAHNKTFAPFLQLMPEIAMRTSFAEIISLLEQGFSADIYPAFDPEVRIASPVSENTDTNWLRTANTVGINVRTIQNFWNIIPYTFTLPSAQNAIHILPIWEPGVVASLYGPSSWNINPEFFSKELAAGFPHLNTVEKQLKVVINILHLLGKAVGMDVVPHTDRFSEMAVGNPQFFEWLQRRDLAIVNHSPDLYKEVQTLIFDHLRRTGSAVPGLSVPRDRDIFFEDLPESERLRMLFGEIYDYWGRLNRRKVIINLLYEQGYETVPATMGPPYRGIEVDPDPGAKVSDEEGREWRDYRITRPETFSRVFGPLARYKLYENKHNDETWDLDFNRPNRAAWSYVCERYRRIQAEFGFDFMRGDMSHVQMRPEGVPAVRDDYYDLLGAVKQTVLREKPYFGYFAESFLAPPGEMAYGDECDHLEASFADSTLGDLQSEPVGTQKFVRDFRQYRDWLETRRFSPNFTIMTADKDDPRFDRFYLSGNEIRYFMALFLTDMPSYMGLGFECRDPHPEPAPNEHYTKLYVFQMSEGGKGTKGPFQWGKNERLYANLVRQKQFAEMVFAKIRDAKTEWLLPPDRNGDRKTIAWTQAGTDKFVFIANLDTLAAHIVDVVLPDNDSAAWKVCFSTERADIADNAGITVADGRVHGALSPGEGLVLCAYF